MTMKYQIQVRGEWAGAHFRTWSPAVCGTLNQSTLSDAEVSTFDSEAEAERFLDTLERDAEFRIVEVQS